jgi:tetratricopeptide (TPR) repeat protein
MPLADLAAQLDHRLALLTDGPRDLPQRQQTLRSAIEWSYDLLKAEEQALFARLGVFAGGGTLDAIEAVCEQSGLANITETLSALIHKSLVQAHAGSNRYTLLETMREYALEQLIARGEAAALQRRHALYLLSVAETAEAEWRTRQQATWLHRLEEDHDNLRAALTWLHRHGETETELRLAAALWKFWDLHGYLSEGRRWLEEALTTSHERSLGREAAQALAHEGAGSLAMHQGDYTAARPHYEQSLRLYQQLGHTLQVAHALNNLGMLEQRQRDRAAAEEHYRESSKLYEEMGDQLGMAWTANNLGLIAFEAGDLPTTRHWYEHCRVLLLEAGTPLNLAQSYQNMGELALYEGNFVEARAAIEESLRLFRELGEQLYLPGSLHTLGAIQKEQDDYAAALHSLNESLALQRELGDRRGIAWSLTELGDVARCQGDEQKARAYYRESLHILKDLGDMSSMAGSLFGLAYLALAHHQTKRATHLLAMAMEWRGTLPMTAKARAGYELRVSAVRAELGEQVFAKEWAHGSALTLDQAVAYALSEPD